MKNILFLVLFALSSQTFASVFFKDDWEKDDCPKLHSMAWCVVKASAAVPRETYRIKDALVAPENFKALESYGQQSLKDATVVTSAAVASYMVAYKVTAGVAASSVLNNGGLNVLLGLDIFNSMIFNGHEMREVTVFAWLPKSRPFADEQADFAKVYMDAVMEVMGFTNAQFVQLGMYKPPFLSEVALEELAVEGGPCTNERCVLFDSITMFAHRKSLSGGYSEDLENPPAFISPSPSALSWAFGSAMPTGYITSSADCQMNKALRVCKGRRYRRFPLDKLVQISERLPATAFIFVGIDPKVEDSIPTVLNQGKVHFFVTEATDSVVIGK